MHIHPLLVEIAIAAQHFAKLMVTNNSNNTFKLSLAWIRETFIPHVKNNTEITPFLSEAIFWNYFFIRHCLTLYVETGKQIVLSAEDYGVLHYFMNYADIIVSNPPN
jgi:hypothetical protein